MVCRNNFSYRYSKENLIMTKPIKLKVFFKDKRGEIIDIFQGIKFEHATIVTFKKGAVRGNHFHKKSIQFSLIIDGKFLTREVKIDTKNNYNKKKIKSYKISSNSLLKHHPFKAHAFKCLSKTGKMIAFTKGIRGGTNYEKDTFRLEKKII